MNINRIKVLGLLGLPLLAIAVAVMVFAIGQSSDSASALNPDNQDPQVSLRIPAGDAFDCANPAAGKVCVPLGAKFNVISVADVIPTGGYVLVNTWIDYDNQGLVTKPADATGVPVDNKCDTGVGDPCMIWDQAFGPFLTIDDVANNGYQAGATTAGIPPLPISDYVGDLFGFSFTCTTTASTSVLTLIVGDQAPALTNGTFFTEGGTDKQINPSVTGLTVNCAPGPTATPTATPPPIPRMSKDPALQNVFLTRQGAKIPPSSCLSTKGTNANVGELAEILNQEIVSPDPKGESEFQQLAAFEFEVRYDNKKVCVDINAGEEWGGNPIKDPESPGPAICIIEDDQPDSKPQLEGVARIGCVTVGKGHAIDELLALASVDIYPQPDLYSEMKPNQDNGNVVFISNVNCDLGDEQGHAIPIFSCDDASITFRYLEGDVDADCAVTAVDAQAIAFRWGVEKGSLIYKDFMNLEPSSQQSDLDIDINDLQFVFGRFGSTCETPHPTQDPVNPKA